MSLVVLETMLVNCFRVKEVVVVKREVGVFTIADCDERERVKMLNMWTSTQRIEMRRLEKML